MRRLLLSILLLETCCLAMAHPAFPLEVSEDRRYLVDQKGVPFPILGRTAWFVISQPESAYRKFLENTIAQGFNSIECAIITHWPMGNHAPFNGEGEAPFLRRLNGQRWDGGLTYQHLREEAPDLLSPNEKYWAFADRFLEYCELQGILVFMFPAYLGYEGQEQGWMQELVANGPARTEAFGAWIADRYKGRKNIVWMLLGDMGNLTEDQFQVERALIRGLKSVKGQQSSHYSAESHSGENAADNRFVGKEMTLNGVYTWELKIPVPYLARKAHAHKPTLPAFLLEEPYDEEGPDGNHYNPNATQPVRRFQWWGWLSTIGGYISGNGYVWQFVDPVWEQHLNTQGATDMERLNRFIRSLEWWKLVPSGLDGMKNLVIGENPDESAAYVAASAARDGSFLVAYLPPQRTGSLTIDMTALSRESYGYWYDPTLGSYTLIRQQPFQNEGLMTFHPPGKNSTNENDWVLLLSEDKTRVPDAVHHQARDSESLVGPQDRGRNRLIAFNKEGPCKVLISSLIECISEKLGQKLRNMLAGRQFDLLGGTASSTPEP